VDNAYSSDPRIQRFRDEEKNEKLAKKKAKADQAKASDLHQTATSLQIAAWALSTLQQSVHGFYGASGICGQEKSSTAEILGSLSQAITGYVPIVTMLGNEVSV